VAGASEALRDLEMGLLPRDLADSGLEGALRRLADRMPMRVAVRVAATNVPPEVAVAVYFACAEALSNVVKHACATRSEVLVTVAGESAIAVVADDGRGGAVLTSEGGLQGLKDRMEGLGGVLTVESPVGGGTRVTATVPVDAPQR
jgi:signal transduction histidine kinase